MEYRLRSCIWEVTLKCNMNCMHCGSVAGRARRSELTLDECLAAADALVDLGCEELSLIGGEVFLYRGWERLARYLSDRGVLVNIMTNAYGIGEREVRQIEEARLANVGISIDGMERNHNRIRGRKDSFSRIQQAFDLLNREGIPLGVVTSLLDSNCADLEEMYQFLLRNNVKVWQLQLVNPMGNMAGRQDLIVAPAKIPWLIRFVREKSRERRMMMVAADSIGYYYHDTETYIRGRRRPVTYWEGCQAGITGMCIDSVGNIKGCGALYDDVFIEGNVRERRLPEIWRDERKFGYNRAFHPGMLSGRCRECDVADVCRGGCRASNFFTTGSLYESAFCCHLGVPPKIKQPAAGDGRGLSCLRANSLIEIGPGGA